jgi:hypothetical protein
LLFEWCVPSSDRFNWVNFSALLVDTMPRTYSRLAWLTDWCDAISAPMAG